MVSVKPDAIKLEGGKKVINIISYLTRKKIPVMGHLGILAQSHIGKFKYNGQTDKEIINLIIDAYLLVKMEHFQLCWNV